MTEPSESSVPNHLARFTALLSDAGYTQRSIDAELDRVSPALRNKDYLIIENGALAGALDPDAPTSFKYHYRLVLGENRGYMGFYCDFYFDSDGNLIGHGAWE